MSQGTKLTTKLADISGDDDNHADHSKNQHCVQHAILLSQLLYIDRSLAAEQDMMLTSVSVWQMSSVYGRRTECIIYVLSVKQMHWVYGRCSDCVADVLKVRHLH